MAGEHDTSGGADGAAAPEEAEGSDVVDFNALHAALGDLPPPPTSSSPNLNPNPVANADSMGKNNAQYASARPHTIPPTRAPVVDPNAPSIVVAEEPPPPPPSMPNLQAQMTIPMNSGIVSGVGAVSPGPMPVAGQLGRTPSPSHPFHPGMPAHPANDAVQQTMHMAGRPIAMPPRRPRHATMVVRVRGPSKTKKILVFMLMLLLVVGAGIAVFAYVRPGGIGIEGFPSLHPASAPTFSPVTPPAAPLTTVVAPKKVQTAPVAQPTASPFVPAPSSSAPAPAP